jgi:hypothetical protein
MEYGFTNFSETLSSLFACDKGRQVLHMVGKVKNVLYPYLIWKIPECRLFVWYVGCEIQFILEKLPRKTGGGLHIVLGVLR